MVDYQHEYQGIEQIRELLESLRRGGKFDEIGRLKDIFIVENRRKYKRDIDCAAWATGLRGKELVEYLKNMWTMPTTDQPKPGDYILYSNGRSFFSHMGIWMGENMVHSKWDKGHVYQHPTLYIPSSYGTVKGYISRY